MFWRNLAKCRYTTTRPWLLSRTIFTKEKSGGTGRSPWIYPAILSLGLGGMAYGLYNVLQLTKMWPKDIRDDLREGIRHRNKGDFIPSIHYLQKAWEKVKSLPLDSFKPDPLLKTTGIAITLASVLENDGKQEEAYNVYKEALWQLQSVYLDLPSDAPRPEIGTETLKLQTGPERMRTAAIAYKLGCMAPQLRKPDAEEEAWLTLAVTATLMTAMQDPTVSGMEKAIQVPSSTSSGEEPHKSEDLNVIQELRLPVWASMHDFAAPFEALGTFYMTHGNRAYALPLYLQAISILIPPPPRTTSAVDRCRGAQLMGKIAWTTLMARDIPGGRPAALAQATSWAEKGLDVAIATRQSDPKVQHADCEIAYIALLFNLALMRRLSGDEAKSRDLYETGVKHSEILGLGSAAWPGKEELKLLGSQSDDENDDKTV